MWKSNGFSLAELLLSLSVWILITIVLLPLYVHMNKQFVQITRELDAVHLLYESIQGYLIEEIQEDKEGVKRGDCQFNIVWGEADDSSERVCVYFENPFGEIDYKCEILE